MTPELQIEQDENVRDHTGPNIKYINLIALSKIKIDVIMHLYEQKLYDTYTKYIYAKKHVTQQSTRSVQSNEKTLYNFICRLASIPDHDLLTANIHQI